MSDPTIQTFCCHHRRNADFAFKLMNEFNRDSYLIISMLSSTIGILGSFYQIFIRREDQNESRRSTGRQIIINLAYSDLLASMGIFVRSGLWSFFKDLMPFEDDSSSVTFCAISSAWVQLFYTSTWLWTLIYAYNMRQSLLKRPINEKTYHLLVWSVSILFTAIGTTSLYYPNADCHDIRSFWTAIARVMPNYILNYGTILAVMIANPILYFLCSKEVDRQLIERYGQYTNAERQINDLFKLKFSLINLIFYICWLPNIVNAILMWTMWFNLPVKVIVTSWYILAILNPLQAFFNVFVYRKWNQRLNFFENVRDYFRRRFRRRSSDENSPLLENNPVHRQESFRSLRT